MGFIGETYIYADDCVNCGAETTLVCDGCQDMLCRDCAIHDEAGRWCEACSDEMTRRSMEAAGGESLLRAEAQIRREAAKYEAEKRGFHE